ncbi:MAG: DUF4439 domain-containing protein [Thermoleophilaceae bacterium]|nr:DUF4439 domain-containing protein [Thermoleophilaceae bacterium]
MHSRQQFLRGAGLAAAGGSAALLAACGGGATTPASPGADGDVAVLNGLLDIENGAVAAYQGIAPLLRGPALAAANLFGDQEQEHADGLAQAIRDLGGTPAKTKAAADYERALGIDRLGSRREALEFAVELENGTVAAYIATLPKLQSGELRGTAAAILTTEAEQMSVLLETLGEPPVPEAFVTGREA